MTRPADHHHPDAQSATRQPVPSYPQIVRIMNLVREEVEIAGIDDEFKADPVIAYRLDRKSTRLNSSHIQKSRMPSSA